MQATLSIRRTLLDLSDRLAIRPIDRTEIIRLLSRDVLVPSLRRNPRRPRGNGRRRPLSAVLAPLFAALEADERGRSTTRAAFELIHATLQHAWQRVAFDADPIFELLVGAHEQPEVFAALHDVAQDLLWEELLRPELERHYAWVKPFWQKGLRGVSRRADWRHERDDVVGAWWLWMLSSRFQESGETRYENAKRSLEESGRVGGLLRQAYTQWFVGQKEPRASDCHEPGIPVVPLVLEGEWHPQTEDSRTELLWSIAAFVVETHQDAAADAARFDRMVAGIEREIADLVEYDRRRRNLQRSCRSLRKRLTDPDATREELIRILLGRLTGEDSAAAVLLRAGARLQGVA